MTRRGPRRRLWIPLLVLLAGSLALGWWLARPSLVQYPIERFVPEQLSFALRVRSARYAWENHWLARGESASFAALREVLVAARVWDGLEDRYGGPRAARVLLDTWEDAVFGLLGEEAWLVFGSWGDSEGDDAQVGMVILINDASQMKARIGSLMDLLMPEHRVTTQRHRGVTIYLYGDGEIDRSFSFCGLGGWICASVQQAGPGPLPLLIDQALDDRPNAAETWVRPEVLWRGLATGGGEPWLSSVVRPQRLWGHLRRFALQRERAFSTETESALAYWQQRLAEVETVTLELSRESLLSGELILDGPRMQRLTDRLSDPTAAGAVPARPATPPAVTYDELLRLDCSVDLARVLAPIAGLSLRELIDRAEPLDQWMPELRPFLWATAAREEPTARLVLAALTHEEFMLPSLCVWSDTLAARDQPLPDPRRWSTGVLDHAHTVAELTSGPLRMVWFNAPGRRELGHVGSAEAEAWAAFCQQAWLAPEGPPQLFAALSFQELDRVLELWPVVLFNSETARRLAMWQRAVRALALGADGLALRLNRGEELWTIALRMKR